MKTALIVVGVAAGLYFIGYNWLWRGFVAPKIGSDVKAATAA